MRAVKILATIGTVLMGLITAGAALAQDGISGLETIGKPTDGALNFQQAVTSSMKDIVFLDTLILWIITIITIFVTLLLVWVAVRYNRKRNPVPATFTHHSAIEVIWTVVPIVILIVIGSFSLPILFKQVKIPPAEVTIKATGNQWYWSYEYPDEEFGFDSFIIDAAYEISDSANGWGDDQPTGPSGILNDVAIQKLAYFGYAPDEFLLAADNAVVVPVNKVVVVQVTGSDVIHSWAIPAFGVKQDGVPGRNAELWFKAEKEGIFFGQCSELCGKDHSYMPIVVKVVSEEVYAKWLSRSKAKFAGKILPVSVASN